MSSLEGYYINGRETASDETERAESFAWAARRTRQSQRRKNINREWTDTFNQSKYPLFSFFAIVYVNFLGIFFLLPRSSYLKRPPFRKHADVQRRHSAP